MAPASVFLASLLVVAPASNGNILFKDVSTWYVDQDWTEVLPGLEIMVKGTYDNVSFLFATNDPSTLRIVTLVSFRGTFGLRGAVPGIGVLSILEVDKVNHARLRGTVTFDDTGLLIPADGRLSSRILGSVTVSLGDLSMTAEVNGLAIVEFQNGEIVSIRIGVPMGWPFQPVLP